MIGAEGWLGALQFLVLLTDVSHLVAACPLRWEALYFRPLRGSRFSSYRKPKSLGCAPSPALFVFRERGHVHGVQKSGREDQSLRQHSRHDAQLANRRICLSGRGAGVHQLARRAARVERDLRAVRPDAPHGQPAGRRTGCAQADLAPVDQLVQEFRGRQGQADGAGELQRPGDRRRHSVLSRRQPARLRRPQPDRQLDPVQRAGRQV